MREPTMKTKQLQWAGILMVMLFTFFAANVYADQASDDAGVKKETMLDLLKKVFFIALE